MLAACCIGLCSCSATRTGAFLSATEMGKERCRSVEQRLQAYQWGGWHRVTYDRQVAEVQERAMLLEAEGGSESALAAINLGLEHWPSSASLLECRAALYGGLGYWRAAECDFENATIEEPGRVRAWEALGRCRQELGLWNAARYARGEAQRLSLLP